MRLGFVINDIETESAGYTTVSLTLAAVARGHEVWLIGVADLTYEPDGSIQAVGVTPTKKRYKSGETLLEELRAQAPERRTVSLDGVDVLMLRNDPAADLVERPWAQTSPILFGQLAAGRGTLVVNDPEHLALAINKTYFQHFPEGVRPRARISREVDVIKRFIEELDGRAVIKPLQGSGGHNVFVVRDEDHTNLTQMIEAVLRDGYAIVQEYLPQAAEGDLRLFVLNGQALEHDGVYAAFRRVGAEGDGRSNLTAGGHVEPGQPDEQALRLVEMVRPKLVRDGMYLVGLDVVGDKLMEVNVFSPGGFPAVAETTGVDFAEIVIADLERKVRFKSYYGSRIPNAQLATL
jgi:glutathione synthase